MKKSLRVILTLAFTAALLSAFAITASAQNWYATETVNGVDKLYITAADTKPGDDKTWVETVPPPYNTSDKAWIYIPYSTTNPVEIIIDGDVVCPVDASFDFGIYKYDGLNNDVKIIGNGTGTLTINLTGSTKNTSAAIYFNSYSELTISEMASMTLTAVGSDSSNYGIFTPYLKITGSSIDIISTGDAVNESCGIFAPNLFEITDSSLGSIIAGDTDGASYGIFAPSHFEITESSLGNIEAGDAVNESCGIFAPSHFEITESSLGSIIAGDTDGISSGIYAIVFKITNSSLGNIMAGVAKNNSYGIFAQTSFIITNSSLGNIMAGSAGDLSYGIYSYKLTIIDSFLGNIMAGSAGDLSYGIFAPTSFEITKSSLGNIMAADTNNTSYGIYAPSSFKITDSSLGNINAGDAVNQSSGIFAPGGFEITESSLGNIKAGGAGNNSYGIFTTSPFEIKNSLLGNIMAGDANNNSYGIYIPTLFEITESSLGNIKAGDAVKESYGIFAPTLFEITNSSLGEIEAGGTGDYSYGIFAPNSFKITKSSLGNIKAGDAVIESYGIFAPTLFEITNSSLSTAAGNAPKSYGIFTNYLTIGSTDPNAKYALDITATGYDRAILYYNYDFINFIDEQGIIKLAGNDQSSTKEYIDADDFAEALNDAKYARIYLPRVATPTITEATVNQQGKKRITITCDTPDAKIYYRLDGGDITSPSVGTLYTGPFEIGEDVTITARGFKEGYAASFTATLAVESDYDFNAALMQYMFLVANQPTYTVSVADGVTVSVKAGLNVNALRAGELVTLTVEADENGEYTAPTVTTAGGGKIYLTDMGGGVYTFKMPSRSVIVKP